MNSVVIFFLLILCYFTNIITGIAIKSDGNKLKSKSTLDGQYIRRKRYLGLSRKFKLNKRYQECVATGDVKGHCKHFAYCPINIFKQKPLENLCVIDRTFVGICCPDDILSPGVVGSQIVVDLPAGGYDYGDDEAGMGCGITKESRFNSSRNSNVQEWPWMAALFRPAQLKDGSEQQFCGGAVITDSHILTAAHCTRGLSASEIKVRLGEYDFTKHNETRSRDYAVAEIIEHEDFIHSTYENDIAIVRLVKPTSFNTYIWPICLPPPDEDFENKTVVVAGWGKQYYAGPISEVLLQVSIPVWPHQLCADSFVQRITESNICAAGYEGGKDSCLGDSGGPLMYQLENGRWITIGIVSWGVGCGNKDSPGIYTKVGNYLPWIIDKTLTKSSQTSK